jgi:hypothetical protein
MGLRVDIQSGVTEYPKSTGGVSSLRPVSENFDWLDYGLILLVD